MLQTSRNEMETGASHLNLLVSAWVGNALLLAIAVWMIRTMITNFMKGIQAQCKERHDGIADDFTHREEEDTRLWDALHSHGHKGLDANNSKVTR